MPGILLDTFKDGSIIQQHKTSETHMRKVRLEVVKFLAQVHKLEVQSGFKPKKDLASALKKLSV